MSWVYLKSVHPNHTSCEIIEFFTVDTKLTEMILLTSKDTTAAKQLPTVGLDLMITGSRDY